MPTVLMTGGHSGLGLVGARTLAQRYGCDLILAGRNRERVEKGAQQLRVETDLKIEVLEADLNSLASVREGAIRCKTMLQAGTGRDAKLQGIICNAGAQFNGPVTYSADGYEETFAGNCLGHFLLVNLLLDSLEQSGRIVWTASGTHDPALMDGKSVGKAMEPDAHALAQQGRDGKPISGGRRYATSKLCRIRNWKDLTFYRSDKSASYRHIDSLFTTRSEAQHNHVRKKSTKFGRIAAFSNPLSKNHFLLRAPESDT